MNIVISYLPISKKKMLLVSFLSMVIFALSATSAFAQFEAPEFEKVTEAQRTAFMERFENVSWTGRGLYRKTDIDNIPTSEVRARLQTVFGDPTKKLEDLIDEAGFRPGQAIQFEYWFTVNDSIPMMVLDVDGPFSSGLVWGGASQYIDLMPQIKREFVRKLLEVHSLAEFQDYFYSPEREQWFNVAYRNGNYQANEISSPDGMTIDFY